MKGLTRRMTVTADDLHDDGSIRAFCLMHYFQDVAIEDAENDGFGALKLISENRIWVMTKLKYRIYERFEEGREYDFTTRPRLKKGVTFFRDFYVHDMDGDLVAAAMSQWCVLNFATRKIERTEIELTGDLIKTVPFEEGIEKIKADDPSFRGDYVIGDGDIDRNGHTNNCIYGSIIDSFLEDVRDYSQLIIYFSKETKLGDTVKVYGETGDDGEFVTGELPDGTVVFKGRASRI